MNNKCSKYINMIKDLRIKLDQSDKNIIYNNDEINNLNERINK